MAKSTPDAPPAAPPAATPAADPAAARISVADRILALPLALRAHPGSDPRAWLHAGGRPTCTGCVAHCCRYVAVEIDRPRSKWQYDQIYWMLLHAGVSLFVDPAGKWYIEFRTRCEQLAEDNRCAIYDRRPNLCKQYEVVDCPVWSDGEAHRLRFETAESFAAYLDGKGIDWRYRNGEPERKAGPRLSRPRPRRTPGRARSGAADRGRGRSPRA